MISDIRKIQYQHKQNTAERAAKTEKYDNTGKIVDDDYTNNALWPK